VRQAAGGELEQRASSLRATRTSLQDVEDLLVP
jgi:hypothetical protein